MTRKSKRELERALDDLDGGDESDIPSQIRIRHSVVGQDGEQVRLREKVIDLGCRDIDERVTETVFDGEEGSDP